MKTLLKTAMLSLLFLFAFQQADAQLKVGYINSAEILADMPDVKQMQSNLEGLQTQLQKKGQQLIAEYQQKEQDAIQRKDRGELSPAEEEKILQELQAKQEEIYNFQNEMQQKLAEKEQELLTPILDKINAAIQEIAKSEGYAYIFDLSSGAILYADEGLDLTQKVKAKLGL
ncbi:MAG TPA: OmpH family outer membrane protein [Phaeodactylibacter sp.]|nr:OmpH family outer membrane protein [Phaeodactylibacter sp.]